MKYIFASKGQEIFAIDSHGVRLLRYETLPTVLYVDPNNELDCMAVAIGKYPPDKIQTQPEKLFTADTLDDAKVLCNEIFYRTGIRYNAYEFDEIREIVGGEVL